MIVRNENRLNDIQLAIHGVKAPFSSSGSFTPEKPLTLVFRDKSRLTVERTEKIYEQARAMQALIDRCEPATFGDKRRTRFDRRVGDAVQLKADKRGFAVEHFDPEAAGILDAIRRQMLPGNWAPIRAELYSLNVYTH